MTTAVTSLPTKGAGAFEASTASNARVAAASMAGTTIEWHDFFIFGTVTTLVFNMLSVRAFDPAVATFAPCPACAVGLFARPLGAFVFGHFDNCVGRTRMLVASLLPMGVLTTLIGLVRMYQQVRAIWKRSREGGPL